MLKQPLVSQILTPGEALLRMIILAIAVVGFAFLFWPQYALYWQPVHTQATIITLAPESVTYKFYVPSINKTLFFERSILLNESQKLEGHTQLEIVYSAFNPKYVVTPALQRPLPVWLYVGVHLATFLAFIQSMKAFKRSFDSPI